MAAKVQPLTADKGATFRLSVRYREPDGSPVDLTGFAGRFVRQPNRDAAPLSVHDATTDSEGWVTVVVDDEETGEWDTGKVRYRLEIESPDGAVDFLLVGPLDIRGPYWVEPDGGGGVAA